MSESGKTFQTWLKEMSGQPLVEREQQTLAWLYYGKTNNEIGQLLGISGDTVRNYVQRLCAKLGVFDRTRAVTYALERGILTLKPNVTAVASPEAQRVTERASATLRLYVGHGG